MSSRHADKDYTGPKFTSSRLDIQLSDIICLYTVINTSKMLDFCLFCYTVLCFCTVLISSAVTGPFDQVASVGDVEVKLQCEVPQPKELAFWNKVFSPRDKPQLYYYSEESSNERQYKMMDEKYWVDTEHFHNLVIPTVNHTFSGRYSCSVVGVGHTYNKEAVLEVVDEMQCRTSDEEMSVYAHGDQVSLVCSVSMSGGLTPTMRWRHSDIDETGEITETTDPNSGITTMTSTLNIIIDSSTMTDEVFTCDLNFDIASSPEQTPPYYHDSCTTDILVVQPATRVMTQPSNDDVEGGGAVNVEVGDVIQCTARARPAASFVWVKKTGNGPQTVTGTSQQENVAELTITAEMQGAETTYTCEASNTVDTGAGDGSTETYTSTKSVTFLVIQQGSSTNPGNKPIDPGTGNPGSGGQHGHNDPSSAPAPVLYIYCLLVLVVPVILS